MEIKVNNRLKEKVNRMRDILESESKAFWANKQNDLKNELISIIVASKHLTQEQQEILKDAIMKIESMPDYNLKVWISSKMIVGHFLFVKKLKTEKAKEEFSKCFEFECKTICIEFSRASTDAFTRLVKEVGTQFGNLVTKYNPKLVALPMRGFLADMNDDGINELILPENGQYTIYYYSEENIKSYSFGNYMALDNFVMYKVDGDNGNKYIYYRDNYSYKSLQGYFSLDKENQLNISIDYPYEDTSYFADWKIIYNNSEGFAKGFESVDTFYAQPDDCHSALLASFSHYNLDISDNSNYSKINGLYYDELVDMLKVNEVQSSQPSFSSDINDYPLYFERLQLIAQNAGSDNYDYGSGLSIAYTYYDTQFGYSLQDLNSDGIPELITTAGEMGDGASSVAEIYAISNNQLVMLCQTWDAPDGGPINGYATSYIVEGGEYSCQRVDLMNNWHVTAVNSFTKNGVTWYELYDTDDGDYYGWLDEDHIKFY